jgi:hypothetical protein
VCSYDVRLKQLPPRSVLHQCFTYVAPQAGDQSLLETMLQEFTAFERLPVTVTEADLLRDIQIHLPERIRFLAVEKNRFAEHASIDRIGLLRWRHAAC